MTTFIIGILILVVGGALYGKFCEKVFGPDDRQTPAIAMADGVDYVSMPKWKNSLINLLNIAGTGPIIGPIQGILFGPIAFITIPVGCVLAGAMHDYFSGMISMRNDGAQMPKLIGKYLGGRVHSVYNIIVWVLMLLVGVVFVYTPGDIVVSELMGQKTVIENPTVWIVYGCIFLYYLIATLFPIDQIIGRIYPIFGAILVFSAIGIFGGVLLDGGKNLQNLNFGLLNQYPGGKTPIIPIFFITVACGILSGFHATQTTLIGRAVTHEKEGRMTYFNMMLVEGFIALAWAAGAMVLFNRGLDMKTGAVLVIGKVSREFLGNIGGFFAILGVVVLPITSGDTAFRGLRLMLAERFNIDQKSYKKRLAITAGIFIPSMLILYYAKSSPTGFTTLWRYFAFTNQGIATFALSMETVYLYVHGKKYLIALIPGMFYTFVVTSYILHAKIGLNLDSLLGSPESYMYSYIVAGIIVALYTYATLKHARAKKDAGFDLEEFEIKANLKA